MSTYGWPSPNFSSWRFTGWNNDNNVSAAPTTMPEDGTVTSIVFFCAGRLNAITAQGCLWNSGGGLIGAGSAISVPQGSESAGSQSWNSSPCNIAMTRGQVFTMGWWRNPAQNVGDCVWSYASGGTEWNGTTANSTTAGSFGLDTSYNDQIGVYIVYTPTGGGGAPSSPPRFQRDNKKLYALAAGNPNVLRF